MVNKPTWRLGEEEHAETKNDSGYHLETPWNAEGGSAIDVGTTELDKVLEHDTPSNRPLLDRDQTTTNRGGRDLRLVDGNHGRSKTNGYASDDPTDDEHSPVLTRLMVREGSWTTIEGTYDGSTLKNGADYPNDTCEDDRPFATNAISELSNSQCTDKRTGRHGRDDGTLSI